MSSQDDLRRLAFVATRETTEQPSYGTAGFRVRRWLLARLRPEGDAVVLWCAALEEKLVLMAAAPLSFFRRLTMTATPPSVRLHEIDQDEFVGGRGQSWRVRAPRSLRSRFDATLGSLREWPGR